MPSRFSIATREEGMAAIREGSNRLMPGHQSESWNERGPWF